MSIVPSYRNCLFLTLVAHMLVLACLSHALAQNGSYQTPGSHLLPIMDVPEPPDSLVSPDKKHLLLVHHGGLSAVESLARPYIGLAGIRMDMERNTRVDYGRARTMTLHDLKTMEERQVKGLPNDGEIVRAAWSSNSRRIAASILTDGDLELWIIDVAAGRARSIYPPGLNNLLGSSFSWIPGQERLVCQIVPQDRGPLPKVGKHLQGPRISDTSGKLTPVRTYRNLLQSLYDEILFDHLAKSILAVIDLSGNITPISEPKIFRRVSPSPDGKYLLTETIQYPYSYLLPYDRFPYQVQILDTAGNPVKSLADVPLADEVPLGALAVAKGPRAFTWQPDAPAVLWWAEALDKGNPRLKAEKRDRIIRFSAPFSQPPDPVYDTTHRFTHFAWGLESKTLIAETAPGSGMIRAWMVDPENSAAPPRLIYKRMKRNDREYPDRTISRPIGTSGVALEVPEDKGTMFLFEERPTPQNERCFLKGLDAGTLEERIVWTSDPGFYEKPITLLDNTGNLWLTRRESFETPPGFYIQDIARQTFKPIRFTDHPAPQVLGITRERIFYEREDGVPLSADIYLPPGYSPDKGPLPTLLWIYPRAFASIKNTAPRREMDTRFIRLGRTSRMYWPLMGYALVDSPFLPIIGGESGRPNDTFMSQLALGAEAVIKTLVKRGISHEKRIAVGGHSYGAFATANLLAHTDLFAAGIARSGAYNRTLTPFGFQMEHRDLWREPDMYFQISPFNHAANIKAPLLLIHGEVDQNTGTFPEQSQRFYHALKGLGATARLVMLPHEDHSYYGRESIMHMIWEMQQWLDHHLAP